MKKFLFLFLIISGFSYAQQPTRTILKTFDMSEEMYDFDTQQKISAVESKEKISSGKFFPLPKSYNERAEAIDYYLLPALKKGERLNTSKFYSQPKIGKTFPPFIATSYKGETIKSSNFKGKIIIINFQMSLEEPMFNKQSFREFLKVSNSDDRFYPVLFITMAMHEDLIEEYEVAMPIIDNAFQYGNKYGVETYPNYIVVDTTGKTVAIINSVKQLAKVLRKL